jgi:hypothetical protein
MRDLGLSEEIRYKQARVVPASSGHFQPIAAATPEVISPERCKRCSLNPPRVYWARELVS